MRRRRRSLLQRRDQRRRRGTSSRTSSRRSCSAAAFAHPREVFPALARVRGHHMAKAAVEMAAWDLAARAAGRAAVAAARRHRAPRSPRACRSASRTRSTSSPTRVGTELDAGYRRIKIKIKPGWDVDAVETIRARFGDIPLMVDANAAYTLADARAPRRARSVRPDDDRAAARLRRRARSRGAAAADARRRSASTSRSTRSRAAAGGDRARRLPHHQHQAGPASAGTPSRSALHDICAAHGIPVWHGGMLESGIGRAHNIHLATLPNFTLPGDIAASRRYFVARPDRSGDRGRPRRHDRRADRPGHRRRRVTGTASTRRPIERLEVRRAASTITTRS